VKYLNNNPHPNPPAPLTFFVSPMSAYRGWPSNAFQHRRVEESDEVAGIPADRRLPYDSEIIQNFFPEGAVIGSHVNSSGTNDEEVAENVDTAMQTQEKSQTTEGEIQMDGIHPLDFLVTHGENSQGISI
jgi:hypothetical protein